MSIGKVILVILATLVIFSTGLITGVVLVKQVTPVASRPMAALPEGPGWPQFFHRIQAELDLTPEQQKKISTILRDSQDRTRGFARGEFGKVRQQIQGELTAAQQEKFEQLVKERQRRAQELRFQQNRPFLRSNGPMTPDGGPPFDNPRRLNRPPAEPPQ